MTTPVGHKPARFFGILPAAGRSRRMGQAKLLLPWDDGFSTIIERVLATWRASRVTYLVVVVHPLDADLIGLCRRVLGPGDRAQVLIAEPPPPDMKDSVQCALRWISRTFQPADQDAWLVAPADLPLLSSESVDRVVEAHDPLRPEIVLPQHLGRGGHPVLFPWPLAGEVARLAPHQGINHLLRTHPVRSVECGADVVSADMDTPGDYRRLYDRHNRDRS